MFLRENAWWNGRSWNTLFGCRPVDARCRNCWAAKYAGTVIAAHDVEQYRGITFETKDGKLIFNGTKNARHVFNGTSRVLPDGHRDWTLPWRWPDTEPPFRPGMPYLIAVNLTGDTFYEGHPIEAVERTVGTIVLSDHIGLFLTARE